MKKIYDLIDCSYDIDIYGITDDSRNVKNGFVFVATNGFFVDHFDYIDEAISNGCVFIVCDRKINIDFPHIVVDKNISDVYLEMCHKFYDIDFNELRFIGITGTDGKTTTTTVVKQLIKNCAYIGTNGLEIQDKSFKTSNTTPVISELYCDLKKIIDSKCPNLAMEVSSEALLHDRVKEFEFDIVGITNITGDHLNIHKTFDNYVSCKKKLLRQVKKDGYVVINGDDPILNNIECRNMYKFGFKKENDYVIEDVIYQKNKTTIFLKYKDKKFKIVSPFVAEYNVYNVVMAFIICRLFGLSDEYLINSIKDLSPIKGRTEMLDFGQDFDIVLDYAHTINGIKSVLNSFKNYKRIITVTGCAGGREVEKRHIIGKYIMDNSDVSIFTMDDPRYESVNDIIDQMVLDNDNYIRIIDREKAIRYALDIADKDSVVLILGKGRDQYMAIEDKKIYYSDYDVICDYFDRR